MNRIFFVLLASFFAVSCSTFDENIKVKDVVLLKDKMDSTSNPAQQFMLRRNLAEKKVEISDALVKDIINSTRIDYDFCVVVEVDTPKGKVECYIYSKNIRLIAKLEKGKSRIDASGEFDRFFTMLDEYYTKIDIVDSAIKIKNQK